MHKAILPECFADTLLIETLVPTYIGYNHKHSCTAVAKEMTKGKLIDRFALGIIDKDKDTIPYLKEFLILAECESGLRLLRHKDKHHYMIQINPALEKWVLNVCKVAGINLEDYDLANDLEGLKKHTKSVVSIKDKKLRSLFEAIRDKAGQVPAVSKLISWVTLLRDNNYNIDLKELENV